MPEPKPETPAEPATQGGAPATPPPVLPGWVRPALEFGPLITFFVVQRTTERLDGLYWATIALMIATAIVVLVSRVFERRWPKVALVTGIIVAILGGITIYLEDELWIKVKPTVVYGTFGVVLLGSLASGHLLLKRVMGGAMALQDQGWRKLTLRVGGFCLALAIANEIFRRQLDTDTWTTVKTFGYGAAFFVFLLLQGSLIEAHASKEPQEPDPPSPE